MKAWKITKQNTIHEIEFEDDRKDESLVKIRISKTLITLSDILIYSGELSSTPIIPCSSAIGIVKEVPSDSEGLEIGQHVYVNPGKSCNECYHCKTGKYHKCSDVQIAGKDYDGLLCDFFYATQDKVLPLPENVSDNDALFINQVSLAVAIIDKLNVKKGNYVAVMGGNTFANILAQLIMYYQAVPILMTADEDEYNMAKNSGIYYVLGQDDNWQKEVTSITGGRMAKQVVYIADSDIAISKAFAIADYNASIAYTGISYKNSPIAFTQAIKKDLKILCIDSDFSYADSAINLIANKAVNFSALKLDAAEYGDVPFVFAKSAKALDNEKAVNPTIISMFKE